MAKIPSKIDKYLCDRFATLRLEVGLSASAFADALNTFPSTISDIESGNLEPSKDLIRAAVNKFNVNAHWLLTGLGSKFFLKTTESKDRLSLKSRIRFPIKYSVPAGNHHAYIDDLDGGDFVDIDLEKEGLLPLIVTGDSMEPKFSDKDVILVKEIRPESIISGEDYAIVADDKTTVKRVFKDGSNFILQPLNSSHSPKTIKLIKRVYEIHYRFVAFKKKRK